MKIGILTFYKSHNYGAFLQCYALSNYLAEKGHVVKVINFNSISKAGYSIKWSKNLIRDYYMIKRYRMFNKCQSLLNLTDGEIDSVNCEEFQKYVYGKFDLIITGSDEVWRTFSKNRPTPNPYWLCGNLGARKMSYAVSSRSDFSALSEENQQQIKECLKDFDFISVRDSYSQEQVQLYTDKPVHICCDPTFLYDFKPDRERGCQILKNRYHIKQEKIVAVMGKEAKLVKALKEKLGKNVAIISLYDYNPNTINLMELTPFEWIDVIAASDYLITNFFHGMCFAIQNNVPFVVVDKREKIPEHGKMYDLLNFSGLLDRFFTRNDDDYIEKVVQTSLSLLQTENSIDFSSERKVIRETAEPFLATISELGKEAH